MKQVSALIVAILLSILPGHSASAAKMKRILVFGDSLSEGFTLRQSEAYPMLLVAKLRAAGLDYEVSNISQSGGTTETGLERLGPRLKRKIDIFILELGLNDAFRGTPVTEIRANLQEILDRVKRANPQVRFVICGMQLPNYSADDYINVFGKMYVDLAAKNNAALVPYLLEGVSGDPLLNLPDRLHPNAAGHKILAENVWRVLEPIAKEVSAIK
ncbi:MAG: arylesterase [Spartobacteria bacterium]